MDLNPFNQKQKAARERRAHRMKKMRDDGKKLREIAKKEGVSVERVRQLLASLV